MCVCRELVKCHIVRSVVKKALSLILDGGIKITLINDVYSPNILNFVEMQNKKN